MVYALVVLIPPHDGREGGSIGIIDGVQVTEHDRDRYLLAADVGRELMDGGLRAYAAQPLRNCATLLREVSHLLEDTGEANARVFYQPIWERAGVSAVLSFASAIHLFQEQTEAAAERIGGDLAREAVEQIFRLRYANCVEHYLVYRLRNLLVHCSMKCVYLRLASAEQIGRGSTHTMRIDRARVLDIPKGVNGEMRNFLQELPDDPDLAPIMDKANQSLQKVFDEAKALTHPDGPKHLKTLRELDALFGDAPGARAVAEVPDDFSLGWPEPRLNVITTDLFAFARRAGQRHDT